MLGDFDQEYPSVKVPSESDQVYHRPDGIRVGDKKNFDCGNEVQEMIGKFSSWIVNLISPAPR